MKVDFRRILLCMVMIEKFRESNVFSKEKVLSRNIFQYLFFSTVLCQRYFVKLVFIPFATCWFHVIFTLKRSRSPSSMTKCTLYRNKFSQISTYHNMWFLEVNLIREELEVVASL